MYKKFEKATRFTLCEAISASETNEIQLCTVYSPKDADLVVEGLPGVILIGFHRREVIGFQHIYKDGSIFKLSGIQRGLYGTSAMIHPPATEAYLDQGELYASTADNSSKAVLKRCLRKLLE